MELEFWNSTLNQLAPSLEMKEFYEQFEILDQLNIRPYQLRFWESEFDVIKPEQVKDRILYSENDFKILLRIKKLLVEDQLTVEKAKAVIDAELKMIATQNSLNNDDKDERFSSMNCEQFENINEPQEIIIDENMNALFEEMSIETFQNISSTPEVNCVNSSQNREPNSISIKQEKINNLKDAIKNLKDALKRW